MTVTDPKPVHPGQVLSEIYSLADQRYHKRIHLDHDSASKRR